MDADAAKRYIGKTSMFAVKHENRDYYVSYDDPSHIKGRVVDVVKGVPYAQRVVVLRSADGTYTRNRIALNKDGIRHFYKTIENRLVGRPPIFVALVTLSKLPNFLGSVVMFRNGYKCHFNPQTRKFVGSNSNLENEQSMDGKDIIAKMENEKPILYIPVTNQTLHV